MKHLIAQQPLFLIDLTRMTDTTVYSKLVSVVTSVMSDSNCVTPEELIIWYDKDIN